MDVLDQELEKMKARLDALDRNAGQLGEAECKRRSDMLKVEFHTMTGTAKVAAAERHISLLLEKGSVAARALLAGHT